MMLLSALRPIVIATALCMPGVALALVYSNLCVEPQGGDIGGTRITLLRLGDGDKVIYEYTEGAVTWPMFAVKAKVDSKAGRISFEVRPEADTLTFQGNFTDTALTGKFRGKNESLRLPRITDLRRRLPNCP